MFRTELIPEESPNKISLSEPILSMGSCFSDCMGERLRRYKFDVIANPFGTVYNPFSIFKLLNLAIRKEYPEEHTYIETQGLWANYDFHSSFSGGSLAHIQANIHTAIDGAADHLRNCKWLLITLGTAFVYRRKDTQEVVANCHKVPAKHFVKEMLTEEQIVAAFEPINQLLLQLNPRLRIIMTVSPVRHVKDTLVQNSVSKAILRVACESIYKKHPNVSYFPSYEIMMDDLRDYRFYKSDMIHPTTEAEDYIWEKFGKVYLDIETREFISEWNKLLKAISHRPFNPASEKHQQFVKKTIKSLQRLENKVSVCEEIELLKKQLLQ